MTKQEAYQFLDIPETSDSSTVAARHKEKYDFFKMLYDNAPNPVIKNLQKGNLDKLQDIASLLLGSGASAHTTSAPAQHAATHAPMHSTPVNSAPAGNEPLAWLVLHTEQMAHQSYPLYEGENAIGRHEVAGKNNILLGDNFVSRFHCAVVLAPSGGAMAAAVIDDGRFNQRKPSKNGTYVNGNETRVHIQKLQDGDTIQAGYSKFVFKWNRAGRAAIEQDVQKTEFVKTVVIDIN